MTIPLPIHLSIHVLLSLLAGFLVWRLWRRPLPAFISALASGVAVDFDHFIDYFRTFGTYWNLEYFKDGYQFLKSDKLYILFHAWEYVIIFLLAAILMKSKLGKTIFLALALGLFLHLCADVVIDQVPISTYSIINRADNNFSLEKLDPKDVQKNIEKRRELGWN